MIDEDADGVNLSERPVPEVDVDRANAARMYDYYLGGSANFEVDRVAAEQQLEISPMAQGSARANRSFLGRAVGFLSRRGIDQFLDLGSGVPTVGNVHEIAHKYNPDARVAYVDNEPIAVAHGRMLLGDDPRVTFLQADVREPDRVLSDERVTSLLDFSRPVAVLAVGILYFVPDSDNPAGIMASYRDACVPGSALAVSHISQISITDEQTQAGLRLYQSTSTPVTLRDRTAITALLDGYELFDPGLVLLDQWRPEFPVSAEQAEQGNSYAAVGLLPEAD